MATVLMASAKIMHPASSATTAPFSLPFPFALPAAASGSNLSHPLSRETLRETLRKFGGNGPRYTSYPTADRFTDTIAESDHARLLRAVGVRANMPGATPLSLYFHLPFCAHLCWYCGCNKVVTKDHGRSAKYIRYLDKEMSLVTQLTGIRLPVSQLHWGGGTPTFLSHDEMRDLMAHTHRYFDLQSDGEYAIEIDPRAVEANTVDLLASLGFNRFSLGVQDIDPVVQAAIHRVQPVSQTQAVVDAARRNGIRSINMDLICGLPFQTVERFEHTLRTVIDMGPERIAIYGYAHLPHVFKPQRRIDESALPSPEDKLDMMLRAGERLAAAGYIDIGMDHYARPDDDLALAQASGQLHRNFQGYATQAHSDLLAFGISSIGKPGDAYVQNVRILDAYYAALDNHRLPVLRGWQLSEDDRLRGEIIQSLMCHFTFDIAAFERHHRIDFARTYASPLANLRPLQDAGLVSVCPERIDVTPLGRHLVRRVAMAFDRYLAGETSQASEADASAASNDTQPLRYSRVI